MFLATFAIGCGGDQADESGARDGDDDGSIDAVIKGLQNPFFATMRDGLVATAGERRARLRVVAAAGLDDTAGQASKLESLTDPTAGCYVVNPINRTNLIQPLSHLPDETPIVNIDSPIDRRAAAAVGVRIATYIGTDNVAAGHVAADAMAAAVDRGARVAVVAGIPDDAGSEARTRGFVDGARGRFAVAETVAADFDPQRAGGAATQLLDDDPTIQGFFAVNDEMALGIAKAVRAADAESDVRVIGMDGTRAALAAVRRGALTATVAQYPYVLGQLGVEACLAALAGRPVPARVDAPVQVVTKANVDRARANFPQPVEPFEDPLSVLLEG